MAQRIVHSRVCDMDQIAGAIPVSFSLDGEEHELDLCPEHLNGFAAAVGPFIGYAQSHDRVKRPSVEAPVVQRQYVPRAIAGLVRAWAEKEGIPVHPRGRLSRELEEKYLAAHR
jgi:Lsr2